MKPPGAQTSDNANLWLTTPFRIPSSWGHVRPANGLLFCSESSDGNPLSSVHPLLECAGRE